MTIISTTVGKNPLKKKWSSPHSQQKSLKCSTWVQAQTWQNDLCSFPRQTIQYHSNPSLCPNHQCLLRHTRCSRTNTQKRCPFHQRGLECKSRKSRDTWNNRQVWPRSTKWSRAKANRFLPREHTSHSKHPLPTAQEKTLHVDITRWSIPKSDWLYSLQPKMEKFYTVNKELTHWKRPWCWERLKAGGEGDDR